MQGSDPHLLHWQAGSFPQVPPGKPVVLIPKCLWNSNCETNRSVKTEAFWGRGYLVVQEYIAFILSERNDSTN